jgi:hypothetical protein
LVDSTAAVERTSSSSAAALHVFRPGSLRIEQQIYLGASTAGSNAEVRAPGGSWVGAWGSLKLCLRSRVGGGGLQGWVGY